jgi:hypothetical protein
LGSLTLKGNIFYCITSAASEGNSVCKGSIFTWDPVTNTTAEKDMNDPICTSLPFEGYTPVVMCYSNLLVVGDNLYGTTSSNGQANAGILFEYDTVGELHRRSVHFGATNGSFPKGSLTQLGNKLYGMTYKGGYDDHGLIFEWNMETQTFNERLAFNGYTGQYGGGGLTYNGTKFYGLNYYNESISYMGFETKDGGMLFEWDPVTNEYSKKTNAINGAALLINAPDTNDMYTLGGEGGIIKYNTTDEEIEVMQLFNGTNGSLLGYQNVPSANSLTYYNGKYYGMTPSGGDSSFKGVIFEWDPETNVITKKFQFTDETGSYPTGNLTLADSKFYGLTSSGTSTGFWLTL